MGSEKGLIGDARHVTIRGRNPDSPTFPSLWAGGGAMRSHLVSLLLGAAIVALAAAAGAVQVEGNSARLAWAPAWGPVSVYLVSVDRNGQGFVPRQVAGPDSREIVVEGELGDRVRVRVAAWNLPLEIQGPVSPPSVEIQFVAPGSIASGSNLVEQGS